MSLRALFPMLLLLLAMPVSAASPVYVGFDGEYGFLNSTSATAIERGIRVAMGEINESGGVLDGRPLELVTRDNRSVPARGIANLREFANNPDLVAVVGGRFSPVILEQVDLTHELGMPLLDAWGSANGITDHEHQPSYTFRLSLRDALAAPVMLEHLKAKGATKIGLMAPNSGWGRSNHQAATQYAAEDGTIEILPTIWYNWGEKDMLRHYQRLRAQGAQGILMVANDIEASALVRQLVDLPEKQLLPIACHWGITGGEFVTEAGPGLFRLDFAVIQTFSFYTAPEEPKKRVLHALKDMFGVDGIAAVNSPVGVAHAYDLTHILARAIGLAGSTDRAKIRDALEQVRDYQGLTGSYKAPFTPESHDAMTMDQVFMARFREDGSLIPITE